MHLRGLLRTLAEGKGKTGEKSDTENLLRKVGRGISGERWQSKLKDLQSGCNVKEEGFRTQEK